MKFAERLKKARLEKELSKSELSKLAGIHYSQIGRYEDKGVQPSADILSKLANVLDVSSDYLMNGTSDDIIKDTLTDKELLNQFKVVEKMPEDKKLIVKELIEAFILRTNLQNQLAS